MAKKVISFIENNTRVGSLFSPLCPFCFRIFPSELTVKGLPPAAKFQSKYFSSGKLFAQQQPRHDIKIIENYWKLLNLFAQQQRRHDIEIIENYWKILEVN